MALVIDVLCHGKLGSLLVVAPVIEEVQPLPAPIANVAVATFPFSGDGLARGVQLPVHMPMRV